MGVLVDLEQCLFVQSACLRRKRRIFGPRVNELEAAPCLWMS